jgi:hypothetical protein
MQSLTFPPCEGNIPCTLLCMPSLNIQLHVTDSPLATRAPCVVVDVVTSDNKLVHMLMDTCGTSSFVQLKMWTDF